MYKAKAEKCTSKQISRAHALNTDLKVRPAWYFRKHNPEQTLIYPLEFRAQSTCTCNWLRHPFARDLDLAFMPAELYTLLWLYLLNRRNASVTQPLQSALAATSVTKEQR